MKRSLTSKGSLTVLGWTTLLAVVAWLINYYFVTPGIAPDAREVSIWAGVSFLVVVAVKKLFARVRRPSVPNK